MIKYFILTFYLPNWFHIKEHSSYIDGAKISSYYSSKEPNSTNSKIVRPVLQRSSYWAHPEKSNVKYMIMPIPLEKILFSKSFAPNNTLEMNKNQQ